MNATKQLNLWRCVAVIALCALIAVSILYAFGVGWKKPAAAKNEAVPLSLWNEGFGAKQSLIDYVTAVTTEGGQDFIPEKDRIAVFDMDGTLFDTEKFYAQAWLDVAEEFGQERNYDFPTAISGTNMGEASLQVIRRFYPNIDAEAYLARVLEEVNAAAERKLELMAGVEEILQGIIFGVTEIFSAARVRVVCRMKVSLSFGFAFAPKQKFPRLYAMTFPL